MPKLTNSETTTLPKTPEGLNDTEKWQLMARAFVSKQHMATLRKEWGRSKLAAMKDWFIQYERSRQLTLF